jgi:biotin carboxylase
MSRRETDAMRHVVVINRWSSDYARYQDYVDHTSTVVTYVCNASSEEYCRKLGRAVEVVDSTADVTSVRHAVVRLTERYGPVDGIVALYEDDQLVAAELRAAFDCPGPTTAELLPFRDKLRMLERARAGGIPVPAFAEVGTASHLHDFAEQHGFPIVLKPRRESSAAGVVVLRSPHDIDHALSEERCGDDTLVAQVFVDQPILHVDGYLAGGRIAAIHASEYVSNCLAFRDRGGALGSHELDPSDRRTSVVASFTATLLQALAPHRDDLVFHLEVFLGERDDIRLLEIGARVGGAMVPFVWREVHGIDLMRVAWDISLGHSVKSHEDYRSQVESDGPVGGWLLLQELRDEPRRRASSGQLTSEIPGLHAVMVEPARAAGGSEATFFEHVGGRFRFSADSARNVRESIERTMTVIAASHASDGRAS